MRKMIIPEFAARVTMLAWVIGLSALTSAPSSAHAQSWGGLYNMDSMLNQTHPFAARPASAARSTVGSPQVTPAPTSLQHTMASAMPTKAPNDSGSWKVSNLFSEIRIGALAHDTGPFSSKEEDGIDTNFELLFASPEFLSFIWSPRPHIGINYNSSGDTSQAYLGLT
mgnify:FL=1